MTADSSRSPLAALDVGATQTLLDELAREERKKAEIYRESMRLHVSGDVSDLVAKYDARAALIDALSAALPALVADREDDMTVAMRVLVREKSIARDAGDYVLAADLRSGEFRLKQIVAARSVRPAGDAPGEKTGVYCIVAVPHGAEHLVRGREMVTICGQPILDHWDTARGIWSRNEALHLGCCSDCRTVLSKEKP